LDKTPFRLIEDPRVSTSPVKRDRIKVLQVALLLSLAAAIGLVLALDSIDPSFRSVDEVESALKVPVITAIQDAGATKIHNLLVSDPKGAEAESFRTMYTSLSLMGPEGNRRTFLITSATPAEGKTFTALHCATAFAHNGLKTVLIDADLRRPGLHHEILDGKSEYLGLSDYLSDLATIDQAIAPTSIENLHFIPPAGTAQIQASCSLDRTFRT
jgi:Mrp family chromosome partitioning ATPase